MRPLFLQWQFDPFVVLIAAGLIFGYYMGFRSPRRAYCFWLALFFFMIATCSPLHYLGMHDYLSAHMIAHILLLLICGPLLVISVPRAKWLRHVSAFWARRSWLTWIVGIGVMWLWHIPGLLNASMDVMHGWSPLPFVHAVSLLLAGMVFSWLLFGPFPEYRIHPMGGILYLGTACISCSLMGLLITFAPPDTYQMHGGMLMSENPWGLTAKQDLQVSGLIMWVPCCLVYLAGCMMLLFRWLNEAGPAARERIVLKN